MKTCNMMFFINYNTMSFHKKVRFILKLVIFQCVTVLTHLKNTTQYIVKQVTWLSMQSHTSSSSSQTWHCFAIGQRASTGALPFSTTTRSTPVYKKKKQCLDYQNVFGLEITDNDIMKYMYTNNKKYDRYNSKE